MYANIVSIRYKSPTDAEEGMKKIESDILPEIRKLDGFQRFNLVRTSETTTMHIGVFDTPEQAEKGRSSVYPRMRDTVLPHSAEPPNVQHGDVRISV